MPDLGTLLLTVARNAIAARFGQPAAPVAVDLPELQKMRASFVTLMQRGELRGCIGSLEAWRPLLQDVQENARNAAFRDPRFNPLSVEELPLTRVEVSLLTPARPMTFRDEADALLYADRAEESVARRRTFDRTLRTPSSSAISRSPVEAPMKTLTPQQPGNRSSSPR